MLDVDRQERYIFKKDYVDKCGTIPKGSQLDYVHTMYYFNGGMCDNYSRGLFDYIMNNPKLKDEYLKRIEIIYNKI